MMKNIFRTSTMALAATAVLCAATVISSCKKHDPVPVVTITTQPAAPAALTEGSITGSLTVAASATEGAKLTYQWYSNTSASNAGGTKIDGATSASYALPATLTAGTYHYFVEVAAEGAKSVRSNAVTVTVNAKPAPVPVITIATQPAAPAGLTEGSIPADTKLTVEATATEGATLKYQWHTYDPETDELFEAIEGATAASYTLPTTLAAGTYYYVCEITAEGAEAVQTDPVTVTITEAAAPLGVTDGAGYDIPDMVVGEKIADIDISKAVTGGKAPYAYTATGLPEGLAIDPATGVISGTPTEAAPEGTATITVKDSSSPANSATVTIDFGAVSTPDPVFVAVTGITGVPSAATAGTSLTLTGTVAPSDATNQTIVWSVKTQGTTGAAISGATFSATAAGTATVTATIANGATESTPYTQDFTVTVTAPAPPALVFTDGAGYDIPAMTVGTAISPIDLSGAVSGGTAPCTFSAAGLPAGVAISAAGTISGTPTEAAPAGTATVTVTDSSTPTAQTKSITIGYGAVTTPAPVHVPVTGITGVPTAATAGTPLTLTGTVAPGNATNQTIVWSVKTQGTTGAAIVGATFTATTLGTATVTATIAGGGATADAPYTQDFTIAVTGPIASGITGTLTWSLSADGTLTITGTGAMPDYEYEGSPWYSHREAIETVVVGDGVTTIGNCAFDDCTALTDITLPDSLTSIGAGAFEDCTALTEITIPDGVTSIGDMAFAYTALTEITIPANVTSIEEAAFYECSALTEITIPANVTSIEVEAFSGCPALTDVTCLATTPPTLGADNFTANAADVLHVPAGRKQAYIDAGYGAVFSSIIAAGDNIGIDDGGEDDEWN